MSNGMYKHSLIVGDKTKFYVIKDSEVVDAKTIDDVLKLDRSHNNIIIDKNYEELWFMSQFYFEPIIYNDETLQLVRLYDHMASRDMFDVSPIEMNGTLGKKLIDAYVFVKYICKNINMSWNSSNVVKACRNNDTLVHILVSVIGYRDVTPMDVSKQANVLLDIYRSNFRRMECPFKSIDEAYVCVLGLRDANMVIKAY